MALLSLFPTADPSSIISTRLPLDELTLCDAIRVDKDNSQTSYFYRNKFIPSKLVGSLHPSLDTHAKLFNNAAKNHPHQPCLGHRPYDYNNHTSESYYETFTYSQINDRKKNLGSGILHLLRNNRYLEPSLPSHSKVVNHVKNYAGYDHKDFSFVVSIFSANRYEWILSDLATSSYSITNTALYDTLGDNITLYILENTESPMIICSKDKITKLIDFKNSKGNLPNLISIVSMDPLTPAELNHYNKLAAKNHIIINDLYQIEEIGRQHTLEELSPTSRSLYTISFTSGTTGSKPKGALITQTNIAASVTFYTTVLPQVKNGRALIFLPLTHIYERGALAFALSTGYCLGFPHLCLNKTEDAFTALIEDCKIFQPHYFSNVPRLLTKLESRIKSYIKDELDPINRQIINAIINQKIHKQASKDTEKGHNIIADNFPPYFNIKKLFGLDNLVWTQTGSAPISPDTIIYLKASLNIGVCQLYGLTETCGAICRSHPYEANPGSCGCIGICCETKLLSKPEMNYNVEDNMGELLIRGAQVFPGYYKNDEETKDVFDEDGWLKTGDIAKIDPNNGRIYIIDRVKNFFKLAQGEYISPEKIENIYLSKNPGIQQIYIHGDSIRSWLVGVVGITHESGLRFLNEQCGYNKLELDENELITEINKVENKKKFLDSINNNVKNDITGIERLHNIHIEINPLRLERDIVTPTLKIKRNIAAKFFGSVFHHLYELERSLVDRSSTTTISAKL